MNNKGFTTIELILIIIVFLGICLSLGLLIKYGHTPASEVPFWVYWLMHK